MSKEVKGILIVATIVAALAVGIVARIATWDRTDSIRFSRDFQNGYFWGSQVMKDARLIGPGSEDAPHGFGKWVRFFDSYVDIYDRVYNEAADRENDYWLDYPPLRLLIMAVWTKSIREHNPALEKPTSPDVAPLLVFNGVMEILSAVAMFYLVRLWITRIRAQRPAGQWKIPAETFAFGAALLVWFNPACLLNSHGWPQWDIWIVPFFIFAALSASCSRWMLCGLLLGTAAFLKGQILIVSAFFPLWAFFSEGRMAGLRVLAGWIGAFVGVASPWLLKGFGPYVWIIVDALLLAPIIWLTWKGRITQATWALIAAISVLVFIGWNFRGSFTWLEIGFHYGSNRYAEMFSGVVYNVPAALAHLGWNLKDPVYTFHLSGDHSVALPSIRILLMVVYLALLMIAAYSVSFHARRHRSEVLLAMACPWILMFALLGQMHERYLLWGAIMSAAAAILRPSLFLLYLALSFGTCAMILTVMLKQAHEEILPPGMAFLDQYAALANVVFSVIMAGAFLYVAWAPFRHAMAEGLKRLKGPGDIEA